MPARTGDDATRWVIHDERVIDDTRKAVLSLAQVELPDGVHFEQYVLRLPSATVVVVLNENDEVLLIRRHRWIIDRWVWEMPGGYVDEDERDNAKAAAREVQEETGWVPQSIQFLCSFQPMVGAADAENLVFLARGAVDSGKAPDINEAASHSWFPIDVALGMVGDGQIVGAASVVGLSQTKLLLERERSGQ